MINNSTQFLNVILAGEVEILISQAGSNGQFGQNPAYSFESLNYILCFCILFMTTVTGIRSGFTSL